MTKRIIIIGAGIVGVATALWLQRDGHHVTLIDKGEPGDGASFGNGGVLASSGIMPVPAPGLFAKAPGMALNRDEPLFLKWGYLPRLAPWLIKYLGHANHKAVVHRAAAITPLAIDSLDDHLALSHGTAAASYVVPSDYLYLYRDEAQFRKDAYDWSIRAQNGFSWQEMPRDVLHAYDPAFGSAIGFGVKLTGHGRITDPGSYVKALADHIQSNGGAVVKASVDQLIVDEDAVRGVYASGTPITADSVVIAAGAWSGNLARQCGLSVPLETERGYHLELWDPNITPRAPVMINAGKFVATPMDGRLRLAGIVEFGGLNSPQSEAPFGLLERAIAAAMPKLTWREKTRWMGHRPVIADSLPVIGAAPRIRNVFVGFGHDHLGLTAGPKTGRLLAQIVSGNTPNIDMKPYAPDRYA